MVFCLSVCLHVCVCARVLDPLDQELQSCELPFECSGRADSDLNHRAISSVGNKVPKACFPLHLSLSPVLPSSLPVFAGTFGRSHPEFHPHPKEILAGPNPSEALPLVISLQSAHGGGGELVGAQLSGFLIILPETS